MAAQKIATCCYCGARTALVLKGRVQHELACGTCGAPLHEMKGLKADRTRERPRVMPASHDMPVKLKKYRRKKRKSLARKMLSEVWDVLEDIID